ncbi:hypothetical protein EDB87DRAFT_1823562 [Lactarius vividus]|nr:hypothetical protein EDB87DRAFT_1823562 [Lactarius vividus]
MYLRQRFPFIYTPFVTAMSTRGDTIRKITLGTSLGTNASGSPPSHLALQLPLELFQKIFLLLVDLPVARQSFYLSSRPDWIAVTCVCRYWCLAALSQPEIWLSITPDLSISWSQAMTERSTPLPMNIDMHVGCCFMGELESLAISELLLSSSRIRNLRLSGIAADVLKLLAGVTHFTTSPSASLHELLRTLQAMPRLEILCIEFSVRNGVSQTHLSRVHHKLGGASKFTALQTFVPDNSAPGIDDGGLRVARVMGGPEDDSFEVWSRTGAKSTTAPVRWEEATVESASASIASRCKVDATDAVEKLQTRLTAWPSVKTLRLHGGSLTCISALRGLSASVDPLFPYFQRVIVVRCAVHNGAAACPDGGSVAVVESGPVLASSKFVQANVGVELVEVVSGRPGLEVVLVDCEMDEDALDALRKRARVVIGDERAYV